MKKILSVMFIVLFMIVLTGCSNEPTGKISNVSVNGSEVTLDISLREKSDDYRIILAYVYLRIDDDVVDSISIPIDDIPGEHKGLKFSGLEPNTQYTLQIYVYYRDENDEITGMSNAILDTTQFTTK